MISNEANLITKQLRKDLDNERADPHVQIVVTGSTIED